MFDIEIGAYDREVDEAMNALIREAQAEAHQQTIREAAAKPDEGEKRERLIERMKVMYPRESPNYRRRIVEMVMSDSGERREPAPTETEITEMFDAAVSA